MGLSSKKVAAIALVVPVLGACVHPGQYKKDLAETRYLALWARVWRLVQPRWHVGCHD